MPGQSSLFPIPSKGQRCLADVTGGCHTQRRCSKKGPSAITVVRSKAPGCLRCPCLGPCISVPVRSGPRGFIRTRTHSAPCTLSAGDKLRYRKLCSCCRSRKPAPRAEPVRQEDLPTSTHAGAGSDDSAVRNDSDRGQVPWGGGGPGARHRDPRPRLSRPHWSPRAGDADPFTAWAPLLTCAGLSPGRRNRKEKGERERARSERETRQHEPLARR